MQSARARIFFSCLLGGLFSLSPGKANALGFTDNSPYGTPASERTEKKFALILPFGIGQFVQDRYVAGSIFLLAEAALLGTSYLSYEEGQAANRQKKNFIASNCPTDTNQCSSGDLNRYKSAVRSADQAMIILGFSALGTMIGGATEAVIYDRKWTLNIGLASPPRSSPASIPMVEFVSTASPDVRSLHPSIVLDLSRQF